MTDSALLKLDWAAKHIAELNELMRKTRPFPLVLKTNTQTGKRTLGCEKNERVVNLVALLCGDAIHNVRSALDHAYWDLVSPYCHTDKERGAVQFPFSRKADRLDKAIQKRMGHYAGTGLYCALRNLKPYGDLGGNILLYLIHELDVIDKHKLLLPAVDESTHTFAWLETIDPNIPWKGWNSSFTISDQADFSWPLSSVPADQLGLQVSEHEFKRVLDVPISVVFSVTLHEYIVLKMPPVIPLLHNMVDMARKAISIIRKAADVC